MIGNVRNAAIILLISMCVTHGHQFKHVFRTTPASQIKWYPANADEKEAYMAYKKEARKQNYLFNPKPVFRNTEFKRSQELKLNCQQYNNTFNETLIKHGDMEQHGEIPIVD